MSATVLNKRLLLGLATSLVIGLTITAPSDARPLSGSAASAGPRMDDAGATEAVDKPTAGSRGGNDPYWPLDGNGGIDVDSYNIDNRYDFGRKRLSGTTTLKLRATKDLTRFNLDFLLPVSRVLVDGRRAKVKQSAHEIQITPAEPMLTKTPHVVRVTYAGIPAGKKYAGESNWLADAHEVVAMNQPHMAPWWFPSNDHPSDKARFDVSTTVANGNSVVGNGDMVSKRTVGGSTTWRWRAAEPMATYLAFFAAGDFQIERGTADGKPWVNAVSNRMSAEERRYSLSLLRQTPKVAEALARDLGPYPFSTMGGVSTNLPVMFALENQTRPTYPSMGASTITLVVHEMAHQWFGDDVSVARWRDIWLNEGPATFMEWRYEALHGGDPMQRQFMDLYRSFGADDPIWEVPIGDPGRGKVFDLAVYDRGAMTLQALRNRIGGPAFWRLLRTWIATKGGGNATSEQFESLAASISGQDLRSFFRVWLHTPSKPAATKANGVIPR